MSHRDRLPVAPVLPNLLFLGLCAALLLSACSGGESDPAESSDAGQEVAASYEVEPCVADPSWVSNPNPPTEVGGDIPVGQETNCQFYQFGWQWFLKLASPAGEGERGFEKLRVFLPGVKDQCVIDTVAKGVEAMKQSLHVRLAKGGDPDLMAHVQPAEMAQATGQALYDQDGNVVLYTIGYSDNECEATKDGGYLPNTIETKLSWRVLSPEDPQIGTYYVMSDVIVPEFSKDPITLGLVGFHLVINTEKHPEFVWLTWEHKANAPTCDNPQPTPEGGWSFLSETCAECLANPTDDCKQSCAFNTANCGEKDLPKCELTGTPNEVCQVFPWGTDPGPETNGNDNDKNRRNIIELNEQLVGPDGFVLAVDDMAIWANYQLVGGLWTNGGVGSRGTDVQRGSLELANTSMETFFQVSPKNCFTCHEYDPSTPLDVSHIIPYLLPAHEQLASAGQ